MRKLKDNIAVSEIFGTILMMVIVVPLVSIFGITFTNMMVTQRDMINTQMDAMYRFIDYLNNLTFSLTGRDGIDDGIDGGTWDDIIIDDGIDGDTWTNETIIDDGFDDGLDDINETG